jgi:MFS family permease
VSSVDLSASRPEPIGSWPSRGRAVWMMIVFFLAAILSYTDRLIFGLLVDPVKADLHISDTQVSLLQGIAFALVYSFAGLPLGRIADAHSRRLVIVTGVVLWSVATCACGFVHSFAALFVARIFVGVGEAALAPAAVSMITDSFPPGQRATAIGVFLAGMAIGGGAAMVIGGGLLEVAHHGAFKSFPILGMLAPWRSVLVLLGLLGALIVILLLTVSEPQRHMRAAGSASVDLAHVGREFARLSGLLVPLYLAVALVSAGDFSLQNWVPTLLSRRFAMSPGNVGESLGGIGIVAGIVGSLLGGVVSDAVVRRRGERGRILVAWVATSAALAGGAVCLAHSAHLVLGMFGWWLVLSAIGETIGITAIQDIVPNEMRGLGVALVSFCNMLLGLGLGTTATALCTDYLYRSPEAVGWSISTVAIPAGVLSALLFWRAASIARTNPPLTA